MMYNNRKTLEVSIMCTYNSEIIEIKLEDLVPFSLQISQTYQGKRLEQLMDSIRRVGLMNPIIVRPINDGKYEILCGHNRVRAMRELGYDVIQADVRNGVSDEEAIELFYDSNLNQQSFSDWNYSQKIEAVKYLEKVIQKDSHQGKRTDLDKKKQNNLEETSVYFIQKSDGSVRKEEIRERMARRLGISAATFSKFRRIIKLPDKQVESIVRLLDQKRISFEVAYRMSALRISMLEKLIQYIDEAPDKKVDPDKLKKFCHKGKGSDILQPVYRDSEIRSVLVFNDDSNVIKPVRNTRHGISASD